MALPFAVILSRHACGIALRSTLNSIAQKTSIDLMPTRASFHLSRIVIIESLDPGELKTGTTIAAWVRSLEQVHSVGLTIEYYECKNVVSFENLVNALTLEVKSTGRIPLLHVECHGGASTGLEFTNGSQLPWPDLSHLLVALNEATRFNLVSVFSACYGAHFLAQLDCVAPAPCYAMIAPTKDIWPDEALAGFRKFYSTLFSSTDAGLAVEAMMRLNLVKGNWFVQRAEFWYEQVVVGYVETHCTKSEVKRRALQMYRKLRSDGVSADLGKLRRELARVNRTNLIGKYFERYFMANTVPETLGRFSPVRRRIEQRLAALRKTGRYGI